jgi:endonuclease/exonuclease/phosphatase family metal-dependent hydrolase
VNILRRLTKRFFLIIHLILVILFLLGCLVPFISPAHCWPLAFLGLGFPFMIIVLAGLILFWGIFDARYSLISVVTLLVGWKLIQSCFGFHTTPQPRIRPPGSITILSYNVHYFRPYDDRPDKENLFARNMLRMIGEQHPDVACFPEFFSTLVPAPTDFAAYLSDSIGLRYRYFSSELPSPYYYSGTVLFSRFPLVRCGRIPLTDNFSGENALFADIVHGPDTFRVFTMHLQSIRLTRQDLEGLEKAKHEEDTGFAASRTIFGKIRKAFIKRGEQADRVAAAVAQSPYPVIVCGDFNDTPDSYCYFKVRGRLQDAFLKQGWGIGRTYMGISPTLRIDYILADDRFTVNGFTRIPRALSDHYPIISNLTLQQKH